MNISVNISLISIGLLYLFLLFSRDFDIYIDFTHVATSNTATDDVINQVTHRIFNTNL